MGIRFPRKALAAGALIENGILCVAVDFKSRAAPFRTQKSPLQRVVPNKATHTVRLEGKVRGTGCQEDAYGLVDHPYHFEIVFWFGFQDITVSGISLGPPGLLLSLFSGASSSACPLGAGYLWPSPLLFPWPPSLEDLVSSHGFVNAIVCWSLETRPPLRAPDVHSPPARWHPLCQGHWYLEHNVSKAEHRIPLPASPGSNLLLLKHFPP